MKAIFPAVEQHPQDLTLAVLGADAPLPALKVFTAATAQVSWWSFTYRIIGESHWITAARDGQPVLHEVLACVDMMPQVCQHHHTFADSAPHDYTRDDYQAAVIFCPADDEPQWTIPSLASVRDDNVAGVLTCQFPLMYGCLPLTRIQYRYYDGVMHWWTLHVYVRAGGITTHVHSYSQCRIAGRI